MYSSKAPFYQPFWAMGSSRPAIRLARGSRRLGLGAGRAGRGVTLFELVIAASVTAILAVLFILSTQYLLVRTKVSRVHEEHRVLARALQNYQMDYNNMPSDRVGLRSLMAPTAYLANIPADPFSGPAHEAYLYINPDGENKLYVIVSAGPDGRLDALNYLPASRGGRATQDPNSGSASNPTAWFSAFLVNCSYDPTNGTASQGDIVTLVPNY